MRCLVYFDMFSISLVARHLESPIREETLTSSVTVVSIPRALEKVSLCGFPSAGRSRFYPKRRRTAPEVAHSWLIQGSLLTPFSPQSRQSG